jgi:Flp pilus assembly protein TadD
MLGTEHSDTITSASNLALALYSQCKYKVAEKINRQMLARRSTILRPTHPDTLTSINNLAEVLASEGKSNKADAIIRQTLKHRAKVLGPMY